MSSKYINLSFVNTFFFSSKYRNFLYLLPRDLGPDNFLVYYNTSHVWRLEFIVLFYIQGYCRLDYLDQIFYGKQLKMQGKEYLKSPENNLSE